MGAPAREFYRRLGKGELATTHCSACRRFSFPPRQRCASCGAQAAWKQLSGRGTVYAFTQQERGLRFTAPDVVGIAALEEGVRAFGVFEDPYEDLAIGKPLEVGLRQDVAGMTLLGFRLLRQ